MSQIIIRGAKTHNLKNINLTLPRDKLIVMTGLSGSGKSSLAFDTIFAEGQRRYVESLSSYARQFLSMMDKPDVDSIEGLSPAISIEQKATSHNPRSTVGTVTEIYDYIRLLFARVGEPRCPKHGHILDAKTVTQMVDDIMSLPIDTKAMLLAPVVDARKGEHIELLKTLQAKGYVRARINGVIVDLDNPPPLALRQKHTIEVVIDRFKIKPDIISRLSESVETALRLSEGVLILAPMETGVFEEKRFSSLYACPDCGYTIKALEPRLFSFNNREGACVACDGLGVKQFVDEHKIIKDKQLSIENGAIYGYEKKSFYYYPMMQSLSKALGFSLTVPFELLSETVKNSILYGTKHPIEMIFTQMDGKTRVKNEPFEGVISSIERRYRETTSFSHRDELVKFFSSKSCDVCSGHRLREEAQHVYVGDANIPRLVLMSIDEIYQFFNRLVLTGNRQEIADKITKEIKERLGFLLNVGLDYLSLSRSAETLSGGEAQRIRLASQIGSGLVGVMYVLDEPSIGLHQRDNERLLKTLIRLRDLGNTVIVVEHDEDAIMLSDLVIDIGPGAGVHGGHIVACCSPYELLTHPDSLTGDYLSKRRSIISNKNRQPIDMNKQLTLKGVSCNNLEKIDVSFPLGLFVAVTGVSGSGKSSLVNDTLYPILANQLNRANLTVIGQYDVIEGVEHCDKVIDIDQSPIGRTPRSNPATYTGLFTHVRELFAGTLMARTRGYTVGRFSFNVKGGRCEACMGDGLIKVEMHFLPDVYVVCDACLGKRYNRETLEVHYKGKNINDVLEMTVEDAFVFFEAVPSIARKCQTLIDVGLSYIKLGQSATTLSGGEAQRIKLSKELSKRDTGKTIYILDEPTTGLHFHDIAQLLKVLFRLREKGNTVIVIEHNLDVIEACDYMIDLGPEGGYKGGKIIATGTPEEVANITTSYTGQFLKKRQRITFEADATA